MTGNTKVVTINEDNRRARGHIIIIHCMKGYHRGHSIIVFLCKEQPIRHFLSYSPL